MHLNPRFVPETEENATISNGIRRSIFSIHIARRTEALFALRCWGRAGGRAG